MALGVVKLNTFLRLSQNSNLRAKTTFHRPMRQRSKRTWNPPVVGQAVVFAVVTTFHVPAGARTLEEFELFEG